MEGKNPLPAGVLSALRVEPPPPPSAAPELFTAADFTWLEGQLRKTLTSLYKSTPDTALADALLSAMITISIGVSTRALKKYFAELQPRFAESHVQVCGAYGLVSSAETRMEKLRYRVEALERALAAGKK